MAPPGRLGAPGKPETRNPKPETRKTRNPKPETRNPKPEKPEKGVIYLWRLLGGSGLKINQKPEANPTTYTLHPTPYTLTFNPKPLNPKTLRQDKGDEFVGKQLLDGTWVKARTVTLNPKP
jgi:hypothetical protein